MYYSNLKYLYINIFRFLLENIIYIFIFDNIIINKF